MNSFSSGLLSIEQAKDLYLNNNKTANTAKSTLEAESFGNIFARKISDNENVKFSKHANSRLESRNINLSTEQLDRLNQGVEKARTKKINESLVMMDNIAFIVNIKNNTVITALDQSDDNVFTNIDGAVIV